MSSRAIVLLIFGGFACASTGVLNGDSGFVPEAAAGPERSLAPDGGRLARGRLAPTSLDPLLAPIRARLSVPALAAAVLDGRGLIAIGAVGRRKADDPTPVTAQDRWGLGSNTKAFTAMVLALLVEERKLAWSATLAEIFPEWAARLNPVYRGVTVEQVLAHRAGMPRDTTPEVERALRSTSQPNEQRRRAVISMLEAPPLYPPGREFRYSNFGYVVAGAVADRIAGIPWERQMRERLFSRLGLDRCDLRPVGNYGGAVEQPWGHRQDGARFVPRPGDPREPSGGAPAGAVFCSLVDWGSFLIAHLIGERGGVGLLSAAGFRRLHTPLPGAEYAFGLYVTRPGWADGVSFSHNGLSDFLTVAWAVPDSDRILVLATNASGQAGDQAVGAALGALIRRTFGWFYLRPASAGATGTYLEVQAGRTAEGSPVALWPLTEAPAQHWKYQRTTRALQNEIGRCLTAGVGVETSFVVSARCTGESRQQWTFRKTGQIINANGACLAVEGTEGLRRAVLEDCDPDQVLHRWAVSRDP